MAMVKNITEETLINRFRSGDKEAFDRLVERHGTAVYNFILFMVKNKPLADDVYQETWMRVYNHINDLQDRGFFRQWLFKIANNQCLNHLRVFKRVSVSLSSLVFTGNEDGEILHIADSNPMPDEELELKESLRFISSLSENLPIKQRQVFFLKMQSDLTFKEIAVILKRPLGTVLTQMRSAVLTIRKNLKEIYEEV